MPMTANLIRGGFGVAAAVPCATSALNRSPALARSNASGAAVDIITAELLMTWRNDRRLIRVLFFIFACPYVYETVTFAPTARPRSGGCDKSQPGEAEPLDGLRRSFARIG